MMEMSTVNMPSLESISVLKEARKNIETNLRKTIDHDLENPIDEQATLTYFESYSFGLNVIDILLDITKSGFDVVPWIKEQAYESQNFQVL